MKYTISKPAVVEITTIRIDLPICYGDEDIPYDAPLRGGDIWSAFIDIDTGNIKYWPLGKELDIYMKVNDSGVYVLYTDDGEEIARLEGEYVPHGIVPGDYGDYVDLKIGADGVIKNWPKNPDLSEFFEKEEQ